MSQIVVQETIPSVVLTTAWPRNSDVRPAAAMATCCCGNLAVCSDQVIQDQPVIRQTLKPPVAQPLCASPRSERIRRAASSQLS